MTEFMRSPAKARVLAGPIGGGKSVCCVHDLVRWAAEQNPTPEGVRKTRFLIVRNTMDQLRSTTMKTVFDWMPAHTWGHYNTTEKTYTVMFSLPDKTWVRSEWMFIALDDAADVRKALSLECTGVWCNEARELHPDVVEGLLSRANRYPSMREGGATRSGGIFDTNFPMVESWWHARMENPPVNWSIHIQPPAILTLDEYRAQTGSEAFDGIIEGPNDMKYVVNPLADNLKNLAPDYYPDNVPGKTPEFVNVFLRCQYGQSDAGMPVFARTFTPGFHLSEDRLRPVRGENYPIVIGQDFGRTPAAVFMQMNPRGQLVVLSELTSENMGLETFIERLLKPHIFQHYPGLPMVVAPDPAGYDKTQVNEISLVDILRRAGFTCSRPSSNLVEPRIGAVERALSRQVDGKPGLIIDAVMCPVLVQGFRYGYKWPLNKAGVINSTTPVKNEFSHPHDALQYGVMVVEQGAQGSDLYNPRPMKREVKAAPFRWA